VLRLDIIPMASRIVKYPSWHYPTAKLLAQGIGSPPSTRRDAAAALIAVLDRLGGGPCLRVGGLRIRPDPQPEGVGWWRQ
jgi:hypothetical protein